MGSVSLDLKDVDSVWPDLEAAGPVSPDSLGADSVSPDPKGVGSVSPDLEATGSVSPKPLGAVTVGGWGVYIYLSPSSPMVIRLFFLTSVHPKQSRSSLSHSIVDLKPSSKSINFHINP